MPLINTRRDCRGEDQLEEVVREAVCRLRVAIHMLETIDEHAPDGEHADTQGYEYSVLEDVFHDIADGLETAVEDDPGDPAPAAAETAGA